MKRRTFVQLLAASPLVSPLTGGEAEAAEAPKYRVASRYKPAAIPGMPGPYPGRVIVVKSAKCVDEANDKTDPAIVREMMERGIRALTGEASTIDAWRRFIKPNDVVGIKVNAGGRPYVVSAPEIVAETVRNLIAVGVKPAQIYVYERFQSQLDDINYAAHLPEGVTIFAAEQGNRGVDQFKQRITIKRIQVGIGGGRDFVNALCPATVATLRCLVRAGPHRAGDGAQPLLSSTACQRNDQRPAAGARRVSRGQGRRRVGCRVHRRRIHPSQFGRLAAAVRVPVGRQ